MINQSFVLITPAELEALIEKAVKNALAATATKDVQDVDFLTVAQSAKLLRVSSETVYRMVDANEVQYKMVRGRIRIMKHSLIAK